MRPQPPGARDESSEWSTSLLQQLRRDLRFGFRIVEVGFQIRKHLIQFRGAVSGHFVRMVLFDIVPTLRGSLPASAAHDRMARPAGTQNLFSSRARRKNIIYVKRARGLYAPRRLRGWSAGFSASAEQTYACDYGRQLSNRHRSRRQSLLAGEFALRSKKWGRRLL